VRASSASLILLAALATWSAPCSAQSAPTDRTADASSIGAWVGLAQHSPGRPFGRSAGNDLAIAAIQLTRRLHRSPSWNLDYTVDIVPAAILSTPREALAGWPCDPKASACVFRSLFAGQRTIYGFGAAPLGLQLGFAPERRIQPFLSIAGGALWFHDPVPTAGAGRFNFTAHVGGGALVRATRSLDVVAGYRLQHISNAGTSRSNPGIDNNMFYLGLVRPIRL
jgi:hypothetical protein